MRSPGSTSLKERYRKWLLAAVLLLSLFTFSVPALSSQGKQLPGETTWVTGSQDRVLKGIRYTAWLQNVFEQQPACFLSCGVLNLGHFYSQKVAISLEIHAGPGLFRGDKARFSVLKTIPQNGKDDPALTIA